MKKIALIYMGGTFGCIGEPLSPMPKTDFLPQLEKILPEQYPIDCFSAPSIQDSSACTAVDWFKLIQLIQHLQLKQYQHFIVIHGTDTLSYAAATLARFLQHSAYVILTGSQYPLLNLQGNDLREFSDARDNLNTAIEHLFKIPPGVYVSFYHQLIHASSCLKIHTTALNAFQGLPYQHEISTPSTSAFIIYDEHIELIQKLNLQNWMMQPIEKVHLATHLQHLLTAPPDVLILQGYGTGNIAINAEIQQHLQQLQFNGCVIILDTQVPFGGLDQRYAVSDWVNASKILLNDTQSHADLYAKILKMYLQYSTSEPWHDHWYDHSL